MDYTAQLVPDEYMEAAPPKLQLYARSGETVGAAVGSPITGVVTAVASVWTFDVTAVAVGYYFAEIQDVSNPNAPPYAVRKTGSSFYETELGTVTPNPVTGYCNLLVSTNTVGARVWANMADQNNSVDGVLISDQILEGITDNDGNATLTLIQYGQFTAGGTYRIRVATGRDIQTNVLVRMPNTGSANLEDLTPL